MTLFLKAHSGRTGIVVAGLLGALMVLLSGRTVVLPQLLQGLARPVNLPLILSLGFAPLTAHVFGGPPLLLESLSRRRLRWADGALVGVLIAPVGVLAGLAAALGDHAAALNGVRDAAAFVALTLALLTVAKPATAAGLPVAYFLAVATVGLQANGSVAWWAWVRADASPAATFVALGLILVAAAVFHRWARPRSALRQPVDSELG